MNIKYRFVHTIKSNSFYFPSLDGLRCIALYFVILAHWPLDCTRWIRSHFAGEIGVNIFFTLSGFLITFILLNQKEKTDFCPNLRKFWIRRALRIFPIYYLLILLLYFFISTESFRNHIHHYLAYTVNIYFWFRGHYDYASHFWTLSVEEQFYLIWPFVILLFKKEWLYYFIPLVILTGTVSRIYLPGDGIKIAPMLTITCLDSLGLGALLALLFKDAPENLHQTKVLGIIGILLLIGTFLLVEKYQLSIVFVRLAVAMITVGTIGLLVQPNENILQKLFSLSFLRFTGKISYGMYLFHNFIGILSDPLCQILHITNEYVQFSIQLCLLYGISSLSFYTFESFFLKFKRYF